MRRCCPRAATFPNWRSEMSALAILLAAFVAVALALHLASAALVGWRLRRGASAEPGPEGMPPITLLRPMCGLEHALEETLESSFTLDYPDYELILCVDRSDDPVVPLAKRLMWAHPEVKAKLLIGEDRLSGNPKLNNLVKGWRAARNDWIVMSDSNVLLPRDFLSATMARFDAKTGLVSSPPVGIRPEGAWGELEAGFLNTYQARWQLAADSLGMGFAQGKTLFWRRALCEAGGGLVQLGREMAEDVASTKLVRSEGMSVRLARVPFPQPIGRKSFASVWGRQLRWAKVRRLGFPLIFAGEVLSGFVAPTLALAALAAMGIVGWAMVPGFVALWFGAEWLLARIGGWPASPRDIAMWMLRDALIPALWAAAWASRDFTWRGNRMESADAQGLSTAD